jgi:dihydrodipicolinate synthase/N-acetylneuraminate lyase
MDKQSARERLCGCYVTVPTMFGDVNGLPVDLAGIRRHVRFLVDSGIRTGTGVLLAGGAAGDFSTLTLDERIAVGEVVVAEAAGRVPVALGAQTTSTAELVRLAQAASRIGADFIQVSPPFYFAHTQGDVHEYIAAAAQAAPDVGIIVYNTFWTSYALSTESIEQLSELPNVVGLKWSSPETAWMEFEQAVCRFGERLSIIDNQMRFVTSHILGARAIEVHVCNYWPQWGVRMWNMLEQADYVSAQREIARVAMPFMTLWQQMARYTGGDGYLDKLCMELVGLGSSRCRPPTRDVRELFREEAREMLLQCDVPRIADGHSVLPGPHDDLVRSGDNAHGGPA